MPHHAACLALTLSRTFWQTARSGASSSIPASACRMQLHWCALCARSLPGISMACMVQGAAGLPPAAAFRMRWASFSAIRSKMSKDSAQDRSLPAVAPGWRTATRRQRADASRKCVLQKRSAARTSEMARPWRSLSHRAVLWTGLWKGICLVRASPCGPNGAGQHAVLSYAALLPVSCFSSSASSISGSAASSLVPSMPSRTFLTVLPRALPSCGSLFGP